MEHIVPKPKISNSPLFSNRVLVLLLATSILIHILHWNRTTCTYRSPNEDLPVIYRRLDITDEKSVSHLDQNIKKKVILENQEVPHITQVRLEVTWKSRRHLQFSNRISKWSAPNVIRISIDSCESIEMRITLGALHFEILLATLLPMLSLCAAILTNL
jgi:hypothetical protein